MYAEVGQLLIFSINVQKNQIMQVPEQCLRKEGQLIAPSVPSRSRTHDDVHNHTRISGNKSHKSWTFNEVVKHRCWEVLNLIVVHPIADSTYEDYQLSHHEI
eukprot:gb/GECG01001678.1/.p1 GENE.gb/GECG01001678.1/~~gb/GECG01001678.1/.p1  ORF type:complete len:102 (+),score=6.02 gb/GECG01001678.1/:1-306(+)